jgi:hypothetical protein
MRYAKIIDNQIVETSISQVQADNRRDELGIFLPIRPSVPPQHHEHQKLVAQYTIHEDYVVMSYAVVDMTPDEQIRADAKRAAATERRRAEQREQLKAERKARVSEPINGVQVATVEDRENISGTIQNWQVLGSPETIEWTMADNSVAALTQQDLITVATLYAQRKAQIFQQYQALCAELETSDDPSSVVWPS